VLTTVSHLNSFVYDLTLNDDQGDADTLGVTGYHRFYTEDRGWVVVSELNLGEVIRSAHGDVVVTRVERTLGVDRVYNLTVEADHVYYSR
jgi:Pretoxin HINT domain